MKYRIIFYCPDQHLTYDQDVVDEVGIGGGITARVRMAHALAELGHQVSMYVNCPSDKEIEDVRYYQFSALKNISTDIFIASTSGNGLDLRSLQNMKIQAKVKILLVHGVDKSKGYDLQEFNFFYALSNFVRGVILDTWGVSPGRVFVTHRGVKGEFFEPNNDQIHNRDEHAIVYASHPSKGLSAAIGILRLLRKVDRKFTLHVYGGNRLWGGEEDIVLAEEGLFFHGLVGQRVLAQKMSEFGFSLQLQNRAEPFGMTVIEAMKAGLLVLASNVGAFPEIINDGYNGFLIKGDCEDPLVQGQAAELIRELIQNQGYREYVRSNARKYPLDWKTIAMAWVGHWDWLRSRNKGKKREQLQGVCQHCGGALLALADGSHCCECGRYSREIQQ